MSSWLLPALLTISCLALAVNIMNAKKGNKSLVENLDKAQAEMKVALDADMECNKQLEMKGSYLTEKDQQVASLEANIDKLSVEKNNVGEHLKQLQEQLDQVNAEKDALAAEKEQLFLELELANGKPENEAQEEEEQNEGALIR